MQIFLLEDILINKIQEKITAFIDSGFKTDEKWLNFHEQNSYKNYCYDQLYPIEKDRVYKKGKIYTLTIRTADLELAKYFKLVCVDNHTKEIKGLVAEIRVLPNSVYAYAYDYKNRKRLLERGYKFCRI
jgi:CRISPR-associated endoribonuclease Cas6